MSSSSGGCIHQFCHVTKPVLASTDINADKLAEFFVERRLKQCVLPQPPRHEGLQLCNFCEVSIEEMRQVLTRSPVKSSALDPLPTFTQRELVDVTPTVRHIKFRPGYDPLIVPCNITVRFGLRSFRECVSGPTVTSYIDTSRRQFKAGLKPGFLIAPTRRLLWEVNVRFGGRLD